MEFNSIYSHQDGTPFMHYIFMVLKKNNSKFTKILKWKSKIKFQKKKKIKKKKIKERIYQC